MSELWQLSISEAADRLSRRELSAVELTRAHLDRIAQVEGHVRAFVTPLDEQALQQAERIDRRRREGAQLGPLAGIPLAIKDVICTEGVRTTCSSKMLERFVPPYDATVMTKLHEAGIVMIGKTNMDEFAMGSSTENSAFFPTRNPWDLERVPGGSSGGSAAAVAAGEAMGALGTDTGGSVRQPGALTNTVAMKPTYGRVSRFGLVAFASSLDQIGPFARSARDAALLLQAIAGHDPMDSTSVDEPVPDYLAALTGDVKGLRIGVPHEYFVEGTEPGVRRVIDEAIETFKSLGAEVGECSLPHTRFGVAAYYIIAPAECSANLARYDGVKYGFALRETGDDLIEFVARTRAAGFGPEVKRRIMLGTYALSSGYYDAYYLKAEKVRTLIKQDFDTAFERFDVLLGPTSPTVAFKLGAKIADPYAMYLNDVFTIPANLAGIPGISIPGGFSEGLPVGLHILGPSFGEARLLRVADAFQRATDHHTRWPKLPTKPARKRG
ncbi:MAG TPA: Asp-tRNA(Asn)/Glu-tRNA(Gln) amidotransferase subunit GatA [Ktedonobacterales bacterium]|nr:Asp-tRNA(Asn)/Glu-tRNA(Gln) amidotransferase subunit GatA [Ktedonobacterales bacterium]